MQRYLDEQDAKNRAADPNYPYALLENLLNTSSEDISKDQANKFLKQKVLEHTEIAPGKMSNVALRR